MKLINVSEITPYFSPFKFFNALQVSIDPVVNFLRQILIFYADHRKPEKICTFFIYKIELWLPPLYG